MLGVVQQGVVRRRQRQAHDGRRREEGPNSEIGASDPGVSAGMLEITRAEHEEKGRDEVGIDVDRLVVDIRPTVRTKCESSLRLADSHGEPTYWIHVGTIPASHRTREELGVLLYLPALDVVPLMDSIPRPLCPSGGCGGGTRRRGADAICCRAG